MAVSKSGITNTKPAESSTKEDLESLLKLAEDLKDKCDFAESEIEQIKNRFLITTGLIFLTISSIGVLATLYARSIYPYVEEQQSSTVIGVIVTISLSLIIVLAASSLYSRKIKTLRKKITLDKLALKEVLQLLRETSNVTADNENWSILSRAEFRIRLSRFNLEDSTSSDSLFGIFDDILKIAFNPFKR
jgi:hypothetical protein